MCGFVLPLKDQKSTDDERGTVKAARLVTRGWTCGRCHLVGAPTVRRQGRLRDPFCSGINFSSSSFEQGFEVLAFGKRETDRLQVNK